MTKIFPRTEYPEDTRINVCVGVANEDFVWCIPAPDDKFIEKAVWRNTSVKDALFRGMEIHE
jgi:hypothetical protein